MRHAVLAIFALAIASGAYAVDGVLEINQTCAVKTGCFAGDTAGFPVTITSAGSYRLTGNLDGSGVSTSVIAITADSVAIDLNDFGIVADGSGGTPELITSTQGTTVRNGALRSISLSSPGPLRAVNLGAGSVVDHVKVTGLFTVAGDFEGTVELGGHCRITNSIVLTTQGRGIYAGGDCYIANNVIENFDPYGCCGIHVGGHSTVVNNTVSY